MVFVVLIVAVALQVSVGRQPSHDGRTLESWLADLDARPLDTNAPVAMAIQAMGTNAIPFLVEEVTQLDPAWRRKLGRPHRWNRFNILAGSPAQKSRQRAAAALRFLGDDARPALPLLLAQIRASQGHPTAAWVGVLAIYKNVPETIPSIIRELNTPATREQAAYFVGIYGTCAEVSVPFLIECAQDDSWRTRRYAMIGIERFGTDAASAEPVVSSLLNDPNYAVRKAAAKALESIASGLTE